MKTPSDIANLKREWEADPIWDIEDTEGFEDHRHELTEYRIKKETEWLMNEQARILAKANSIGAPGNIALARYMETLEYHIGRLQNQINELNDRLDNINKNKGSLH